MRHQLTCQLLGKSTTLKSTILSFSLRLTSFSFGSVDFQLTYAPQAWAEERAAWRTVIHLNFIRNVVAILDILDQELMLSAQEDDNSDFDDVPVATPSTSSSPLPFSEKHRLLRLRLLPLRSLQGDLRARIGASDWPAPRDSGKSKAQDFFVRSHTGWKSALRPSIRSVDQERNGRKSSDETGEVLSNCAEDIKALWEDSVIKEMLKRRRIRLDLMPGLYVSLFVFQMDMFSPVRRSFLHDGDIERIAKRNYVPADADVVRARLRTIGVQEHRIHFESGQYTRIKFLESYRSRLSYRPCFWHRLVYLRCWWFPNSGEQLQGCSTPIIYSYDRREPHGFRSLTTATPSYSSLL